MKKSDILKEIARETRERYSCRLRKFGRDVRTLGWGTRDQQWTRFEATLYGLPHLHGKTILDIGCGFGDYLSFLREKGIYPSKYIGWDLNPELIEEAKKIFKNDPVAIFEVKNILELNEKIAPVAEVGIMLGVLNYNLRPKFDNYEYSKLVIKKAFSLVSEVLVVDFLSSYRAPDYPKEDFVFYHRPEVMLEFALSLTPKVLLKHDYNPIPQREFMLFFYHSMENCIKEG